MTDRFIRQTCVPGVNQGLLTASKVLVVGAGGTGSPVVLYLAGAGVGHIDILDPDIVEESNLHRQVLYTSKDLGKPKARLASERARALGVRSAWANKFWGDPTFTRFKLSDYDLVMDCTDHWIAHDRVIRDSLSSGIPVVHGSIQGLLGRVFAFYPDEGPCWNCLHPNNPEGRKDGPGGTLGPVCGVVGSMMVFEALRILQKWPKHVGQMKVYNATQGTTQVFEVPISSKCDFHGKQV